MTTDFPLRPHSDYQTEQAYLTERMHEIERDMGRVAARLGEPTPITEGLDTLDRARELVGHLFRQVTVTPLDEALDRRLEWLRRTEKRQGRDDGEPKLAFNRIPLDIALLESLRDGWRKRR